MKYLFYADSMQALQNAPPMGSFYNVIILHLVLPLTGPVKLYVIFNLYKFGFLMTGFVEKYAVIETNGSPIVRCQGEIARD